MQSRADLASPRSTGARLRSRGRAGSPYARRVWSQRAVIDYSLARRATLTELFSRGGTTLDDACDAHPYLLRAAKHHGEPTRKPCPVCRRESLTHVTYVYGDELGQYSGRIRSTAELETMAREHGEFTVYVVEVCQGCAWNHLALSYVLGDGTPRKPLRKRNAVSLSTRPTVSDG
jgi:Family of unknown function (DUF5318)